jgi:hypothetical protein
MFVLGSHACLVVTPLSHIVFPQQLGKCMKYIQWGKKITLQGWPRLHMLNSFGIVYQGWMIKQRISINLKFG